MWEAICGLFGAVIGAGLAGWTSLSAAKRSSNAREEEIREERVREALELGIQIRIKGRDVIVFLQDTMHAISYGQPVDLEEFKIQLADLHRKSYEAQANAGRALIHVGSGSITFNQLAHEAGRELGLYIFRLQNAERGLSLTPPLSFQLMHPQQLPDAEAVEAVIEDANKARVYLNETYLLALKRVGIDVQDLPLPPSGHRDLPGPPQDM
ncbi:hypothetical protein ACIBMX_10850 [Streptomyces phaeochromogenes]|uniref:hypothetical protein n=1 Tax=Streptomyces phaeochromogenes TaxID=1923 RepID=UPI003407D58D